MKCSETYEFLMRNIHSNEKGLNDLSYEVVKYKLLDLKCHNPLYLSQVILRAPISIIQVFLYDR